MNGIAGFIKTADVFDKVVQRDLVGVLPPLVIQNFRVLTTYYKEPSNP